MSLTLNEQIQTFFDLRLVYMNCLHFYQYICDIEVFCESNPRQNVNSSIGSIIQLQRDIPFQEVQIKVDETMITKDKIIVVSQDQKFVLQWQPQHPNNYLFNYNQCRLTLIFYPASLHVMKNLTKKGDDDILCVYQIKDNFSSMIHFSKTHRHIAHYDITLNPIEMPSTHSTTILRNQTFKVLRNTNHSIVVSKLQNLFVYSLFKFKIKTQ